MKDYYVIKKGKELIKGDGNVLFFEYPIQAQKYIENYYNGSPYLKIKKWVKKN